MISIGITGKNILELREKKGWSQQKLADLLKVEIVTISRWERAGEDEASIKSTMYAVLLPILVSAGIKLSISKELRENKTKLFEKLAKITALGLSADAAGGTTIGPRAIAAALAPTTLMGGLFAALVGYSGLFAAKAINDWMRGNTDKKGKLEDPQEEIPLEVEKAILYKELADIQSLYLQQKEAWEKIEKENILQDHSRDDSAPKSKKEEIHEKK